MSSGFHSGGQQQRSRPSRRQRSAIYTQLVPATALKGQKRHSDEMNLQRQPQSPPTCHTVRGAHDGPTGRELRWERSRERLREEGGRRRPRGQQEEDDTEVPPVLTVRHTRGNLWTRHNPLVPLAQRQKPRQGRTAPASICPQAPEPSGFPAPLSGAGSQPCSHPPTSQLPRGSRQGPADDANPTSTITNLGSSAVRSEQEDMSSRCRPQPEHPPSRTMLPNPHSLSGAGVTPVSQRRSLRTMG